MGIMFNNRQRKALQKSSLCSSPKITQFILSAKNQQLFRIEHNHPNHHVLKASELPILSPYIQGFIVLRLSKIISANRVGKTINSLIPEVESKPSKSKLGELIANYLTGCKARVDVDVIIEMHESTMAGMLTGLAILYM